MSTVGKLAEEFALEKLGTSKAADYFKTAMIIGFIEGYNTAAEKQNTTTKEKSLWTNVEDGLPEETEQVLIYAENTEVPWWSGLRLGHYEDGSWYFKGGRDSDEVVTRWVEIPK